MEPVSFRDEVKTVVIDVGVGTTDVVAYTGDPEYSPRFVAPSRVSTLAQRLRSMLGDPPRYLALVGVPMGGGPTTKELKRLMGRGTEIYAELDAALTLHNDVRRLEEMPRLHIVEDPIEEVPPDSPVVETYDFRVSTVFEALQRSNVDTDSVETIVACVQDHGYHPNYESNRKHRFERLFRQYLGANGCKPDRMAFDDVPPESFPRLRTAYLEAESAGVGAVAMDSKVPIAMLGRVDSDADRLLVIDYGTGHVTAFLFDGDRIVGVYEHHTARLSPEKFERQIREFVEGELENEDVYRDGGHGCHNVSPIDWDEVEDIVSLGPKKPEFQLGRDPERFPDRMMPAYGPAVYLTDRGG
ncbi:DUF1786 domain-containing protein [Methanopyrus sp.]